MSIKQPPAPSNISDVERDTGLAKETLRVWERRYAFPQPLRDAQGERLYPADQVFKLRLIKQLMDLGYRPGKMVQHSTPELLELRASTGNADQQTHDPALQMYLDLCKVHQIDTLRDTLSQALLAMGVKRFVIDLIAPLSALIGTAWARGELAVFEEHLYTECVQSVLRTAIFAIAQQRAASALRPRILLTTLPQERHGLGLLMAEALYVNEGAHCLSLGVQTPLQDIVDAASAQRADIVALSFSSAMNPRQASDALSMLRAALPDTTQIWAGGNCSALGKRLPALVRVFTLDEIGTSLAQWQSQAGTPLLTQQ
ncbi:MAG: DNA-binding transcriptional MerR regulator/methylmalonyl-CoA mutase cobalamin-binding subunit [Janthinobacterium sp.]|jgi:DNA-binding transcriptional MerR regulator/methylmalonyl-CoA mutase cobalamin-binding subunit